MEHKELHDLLITKMKPFINLKHSWHLIDLLYIHPILLMILAEMAWYCSKRTLDFTITSIIRPRIDGISVSDTHKEGRAFDLSCTRFGWDEQVITVFVSYFNLLYADLYGTAPEGKKPRVVIYEKKGTAPHLHVQIRRGLIPTYD